MPLARGSALCGYVSLLGAFLAAGAPVRACMPEVSVMRGVVASGRRVLVAGAGVRVPAGLPTYAVPLTHLPPCRNAALPDGLGGDPGEPALRLHRLGVFVDAAPGAGGAGSRRQSWRSGGGSGPSAAVPACGAAAQGVTPACWARLAWGRRTSAGLQSLEEGCHVFALRSPPMPSTHAHSVPPPSTAQVIELLPTMRARLEALNGPRVPRI